MFNHISATDAYIRSRTAKGGDGMSITEMSLSSGISPSTIRGAIDRGELRAVTIRKKRYVLFWDFIKYVWIQHLRGRIQMYDPATIPLTMHDLCIDKEAEERMKKYGYNFCN